VAVHPLDNPIWTSLTTRHQHLARRDGKAVRYPAEIAPFVAVERADAEAAQALERLLEPGESVYLVGVVPPPSEAFEVHADTMPQLCCQTTAAVPPAPGVTVMTAAHSADMLSLTARVFPGFFRRDTIRMGQYLGIYVGPVLAAMAGERLAAPDFQELSAVCTDPAFLGRGYARHLVARLTNAALARGQIPYLHVHRTNTRARDLYERTGYRVRCELALVALTRR
jgi:ribosomal protein S18 acetylase RimI-like enzyme